MKRLSLLAVGVLAFSFVSAPALALSSRTFVSGAGTDTGVCANNVPCRTLAYAITQTAPSGEIDALDPAGYGSVTITKSISIQGHGFAGIAVASGTVGITVNAAPTDVVNLNGLLIDGNNVGSAGIAFHTGAALTVENCIVRKMGGGSGLAFRPTGTTTQTLAVSDSYFSDNASNGLDIEPQSSGAVTAAITRSGFYDNANSNFFVYGAGGTGAITVAVSDSVAANGNKFNGNTGFEVESGSAVSNLSLTRCLVVGNSLGLEAGSSHATLWLAQTTVTGNGQGFSQANGGVIMTYGDNYLAASNGTSLGTLTSVGKQ